ncbi:E3 ubiquitin-protein ligase XIAP-like [Lutzomyia longipalpis]|uniref:Putative apoptosis inhibitor iap n=1 Tax=Lutzomyia longipalpis TaxID=7200 RepID=A0A1B0GIB8_LUTLO|nr:E3 ubiquitin-protein ligase XIAP-like [Lutzomyia longipalpis]XP_055677854.1 E3 ubiquitin-protein ligase XIAP-like [Lutzomyia longipalpis]XP_055677861.1 E3 ubiquitin-protein ligase XIAP-like [Lutzomyia longipalpis]
MAMCLSCICGHASDDDGDEGDMRQESQRLATMEPCTNLTQFAAALALQGFFLVALASPDEVQCYFCGVRLSSWEDDDVPLREHLRHSNNCPLLRGEKTDNVPINARVMVKFLRDVYKKYLSVPTSPYCREDRRLESFDEWPGGDARELARFGFYYVGTGWDVECIFCYMRLDMTPPVVGDIVARHLEAPDCPLFRGRASTNVPLEPEQTNRLIYELAGQRPASDCLVLPAERHEAQEKARKMPRDPRRVSIITNPLNERYVHTPMLRDLHIERNRLKSFHSWRGMADKHELARQGFYFTGIDDVVQCIFCRTQFSNWQPESDILEAHATPGRCPFLRGFETANVPLAAIMEDDSPRNSPLRRMMECDERCREICDETVEDDKMCKICYENPYETVCLPCGHVAMCTQCASAVDRCPFCQQRCSMARLYFM